MNKAQIIELLKVQLIYINPQATIKAREKGHSGKKLFRGIFLQNLFLTVMFLVMYGVMMLPMNFPKLPGMFTIFATMFSLLAFAQVITSVFNIFYDSKDFKDYLPLPFDSKSIYFAKFLVVSFTILVYGLPIFALFVITSIQQGMFLPVGIALSLLLFFVFLCIIVGLGALIVSFLVQSKAFNKHKKIVTTLLMTGPVVIMAIGLVYLQNSAVVYDVDATNVIMDQPIIYLFYPFFLAITQPFSVKGLLSYAFFALLIVVFYQLLSKTVVPKIQEFGMKQETRNSKLTVKTKKSKSYKSLNSQLWSYNFSLIKNPSLLMQVFLMTLLFPMMMIFPGMSGGADRLFSFDSMNNPSRYFGVAILVGIFLVSLTTSSSSLPSMMLSLDRGNFLFIRSLPINFSDYIKEKFKFALCFQLVMELAIVLVASIVLDLPLVLSIGLIFGNLLATYMHSLRLFARDYRLLNLNWTNISQLVTRGNGSILTLLSVFGSFFVGIILMFIVVMGIIAFPAFAFVINLFILILLLIILVLVQIYYNKKFWQVIKQK